MIADALDRWVRLPTVVLEILAGIVIGPVTGWADVDEVIRFLSQLGLCTLMFLGGLEVDVDRVRGTPLRRATIGWVVSLAAGAALGLSLSGVDGGQSGVMVGLCLTTTAFGVLLPILRDRGELPTPFGTSVMAGASVGEIGPIVAVALLFSTDGPVRTGVLLVAFVAVVAIAVRLARRERNARLARVIEATLDTSGQLGVRLVVVVLVVMVWVAAELGLDVLVGAFAAGMVMRLFAAQSSGHEIRTVESKLHGLGFGFVIPIFFVVSGMQFDLDSIVDDPVVLVVVPVILVAMFVVRGLPAALAERHLPWSDRLALACYLATGLPLIVVITAIGTEEHGLGTATAAALVAAGMASVVLFPLLAATFRHHGSTAGPAMAEPARGGEDWSP